ncbi:MAG: DUF5117 domain-containing protein [candidate division Zixibacteria bacterium]|nr:DUF5117 domain-containing protein [candidate division Zixibacteria bacterium]
MAKRSTILAIAIILLSVLMIPAWAIAGKKENDKAKASKSKDKPFAEVIKDYEKVGGFFTFYIDREEGKTYMAITPEQMDRMFLCSLTRSAGDGSYYDSGADQGEFVFSFHRVGKNIQMLEMNLLFRADTSAALHPAVQRGVTNSIYGVAKIESAPDSSTGAVLVDASGLLIQDIPNAGYYLGTSRKLGYSFDSNNSFFGEIKSFPENSEIDVHLHYKTKKPNSSATMASPYSMFLVYHYSITGIPETDYMPRIADDRVGYFVTVFQDYSNLDPESPYVRYINRWNLKKANPELPVSKPVEPIVFWIGNTVPEEYRPYVRDGLLYWNKAFRRAGFQDAIEVKQMPDDAEWDPADVRYNVIQWIVYPGKSYAVGPSHANPFTGEIYDADIRVCADFIRWMFIYGEEFVEPVSDGFMDFDGDETLEELMNPDYCNYEYERAKDAASAVAYLQTRDDIEDKSYIIQEYVRQYVVDLVAHEVGHTLGLRHNFKASTMLSSAQMHDTTITRYRGMVGSTMDYNPANLALPGETQGDFYNLTPGPYDYWAIEYGYTAIDAASPEDELPRLRQIAGRSSEPDLTYGTDDDAFGNSVKSIDPDCNQFDLGKDPIEYYQRRILLSKRLWEKMEREFNEPGTRYNKLRNVFARGFSAFSSGANIVSKYIGGMYTHRDHIGTPKGKLPFEPVPAAKQREAMEFLKVHIFAPEAFSFRPDLLNKLQPEKMVDFEGTSWKIKRLDYPVHDVVLRIQTRAMDRLFNPLTLQRMVDMPLHYGSATDVFSMTEMFTSLRRAIWTPEVITNQNINSFRRNLQRAHLDRVIDLATGKVKGAPEDARTLARVDLDVLEGAIAGALRNPGLNTITKGHLQESLARIKAAMDAGMERSAKG